MKNFDLGGLLGSPEGMGLLVTALMGGKNFMQGNQAAMRSQDPTLMMQNNLQQGGLVGSPQRMKSAGQTLDAMGKHPGMGGDLGAAALGNMMVDGGATLTAKQSRVAGPQMAQTWKGQGAVAPGLLGSFAGALGPGMALGGAASKLFRG